jgi:hypothetical protein
MNELSGARTHPIPIMIRIDKLHSDAPKAVTHSLLTADAERFLSGLDPMSLSQTYQ